jgi:two-component system, sensor histidine kinase
MGMPIEYPGRPMNRPVVTDPDTKRALLYQAEQIRTHYRGMPTAFIGIAVVATVVAWVLPLLPNPYVVPVWLAGVYGLSLFRYFLWRRYQAVNPPVGDCKRWGVYATVVYALSGVLWGAGNIVLYPPDHLEYQFFLLVVSLGAAMGAYAGLVSYLPAFYAFMFPLLLLAAASFAREPDAIHLAVSVLILLYLAISTRLAQNLHRAYTDALSLRFDNLELIEDLRRQKLVAEEANVAKSRFLAAASHDLRQPMHALGLFVQTLQDANLPETERATVVNVRRSVDAMEELFNALLDISRLDAGVVTAAVVTTPVESLLERIRSQFEPLAWAKGLTLHVRASDEFVRSDPVLLERIVRNLVSNAVKHTRSGGVVVGVRRRGEAVSIEVWDSGPGIVPAQQQEIFREFHQLRNPERDCSKGLGLGLAIVDRLSVLLNHPVTLVSRPGKGSVFRVQVARGRADEVPTTERRIKLGDMAGFHDALVCVVDDEESVREGMKSMLRKWSCDVLVAGSGAELMQKLMTVKRVPDLVISDYRLRKEENGIHVIESVREEYNAPIPALLVTGDTGPERLREALASGLIILHKPVNPARLRTLMTNLLRKRLTSPRG